MKANSVLSKLCDRAGAGIGSVYVLRFDDGAVSLSYDVHVTDASGRIWQARQAVTIPPADLVEVHAALGRVIDANLHAEADKSITPKE